MRIPSESFDLYCGTRELQSEKCCSNEFDQESQLRSNASYILEVLTLSAEVFLTKMHTFTSLLLTSGSWFPLTSPSESLPSCRLPRVHNHRSLYPYDPLSEPLPLLFSLAPTDSRIIPIVSFLLVKSVSLGPSFIFQMHFRYLPTIICLEIST